MSARSKISICIPSYNQAQYIRQSVESALAQAGDLEIVVSENYSTDGTWSYLSTLKDPRLHLIRPAQHLPMAENWRFCVAHAQGDYINILSSDDALLPGYARKMTAVLEAYPGAAFAYCAAQLIDAGGKTFGVERHLGGSFLRKGRLELRRFVRGAGCVLTTLLFRRKCYDRAGGFRLWEIVGDWDLELRLLQTGDVAYLDEVLAQYRIWATSERRSRSLLQLKEIAQLYETTVEQIQRGHPDLKRLIQKARREYAFSCALSMQWKGSQPEFEETSQQIRRINDTTGVRFVLWLHHRHLSGWIMWGLKIKGELRQRVKSLFLSLNNRRLE